MNISVEGRNKNIAVINSDEELITDLQSALDLAMTVGHEMGVYNMVLAKDCITEDFFVLSSRLAGEILQKYVNYGIKLAVVGDFSSCMSKPLHDFIYECNRGRDFFFVDSEKDAVDLLEKACKQI